MEEHNLLKDEELHPTPDTPEENPEVEFSGYYKDISIWEWVGMMIAVAGLMSEEDEEKREKKKAAYEKILNEISEMSEKMRAEESDEVETEEEARNGKS